MQVNPVNAEHDERWALLVDDRPAIEQRAQMQQHDATQVEFQAGLAGFEHDEGQQRPDYQMDADQDFQEGPAAVDREVRGWIPDEDHRAEEDPEEEHAGGEMERESAESGHGRVAFW